MGGLIHVTGILGDYILSGPCLAGDGKIVLEDDTAPSSNGPPSEESGVPSKRQRTTTHPVDLELEVVLGKMPQKVLYFVCALSGTKVVTLMNEIIVGVSFFKVVILVVGVGGRGVL